MLDASNDVVDVGSCPICGSSNSPASFEDMNGIVVDERSLPTEKLLRARVRLYSYKSGPR